MPWLRSVFSHAGHDHATGDQRLQRLGTRAVDEAEPDARTVGD